MMQATEIMMDEKRVGQPSLPIPAVPTNASLMVDGPQGNPPQAQPAPHPVVSLKVNDDVGVLSTPPPSVVGTPNSGEGSGRGGRRRGSKNFNDRDTEQMLVLCERMVPVTCREWDSVAVEFNKWADENNRPKRPRASLRNKFERLCTATPGGAQSPHLSSRAKAVETLILQAQNSREGRDSDDDGGSEGGGGDDGFAGNGSDLGESGGSDLLKKRRRSGSSSGYSSKRRRTNSDFTQMWQEVEERRIGELRQQEERYQTFQRAMMELQMEFQEKMLGMMRQMLDHAIGNGPNQNRDMDTTR